MDRSVRMLGVQPLDRLGQAAKMPSRSLLWRAVLEVITIIIKTKIIIRILEVMMEKAGVSADNRSVGRIAAKCQGFPQYVRKAEQKLGICFDLTDGDIEELYSDLEKKHWKQLVCFYQYRALFALLIESIILTDRLLYLKEKGILNAMIVKLFDSVVSPRCYALVAIKNP